MRARAPWRPYALAALLALGAVSAPAPAAADGGGGPGRVDFDDRLVKGQRHGTGSIYIFERQKVEMRSMVKKPRSFRQRIILTVFPE